MEKVMLSDLLSNLCAKDKGTYFSVICPECGRHEGYIYKDVLNAVKDGSTHTVKVHCHRLNNCGKTTTYQNVFWDEKSLTMNTTLDEVDTEKLYPTLDAQQRITALTNSTSYGCLKDYEKFAPWRGISEQILKEYRVAYLCKSSWPKGWQTFMEQMKSTIPASILEKNYLYQTRDIVIPFYNEEGLVDRVLLRSNWAKNLRQKEVTFQITPKSIPIWNRKDINSDGEFLFITEGVVDALSIKEVDSSALVVALPGVGQWKRFTRFIATNAEFKKTIVICFDNDKAGEKCARGLEETLKKMGHTSRRMNLHGFNDVNELLVADRNLLSKTVKQCLARKVVFNEGGKENVIDFSRIKRCS